MCKISGKSVFVIRDQIRYRNFTKKITIVLFEFLSMTHIKTAICPVCQGTQFHKFLDCKDNYATGELFEIEECDKCRFRFTQNFPDEKEIGRYYDTVDYVSHSDTKKGLINRLYHAVRVYMLTRKASLIECFSGVENGRLLDIGCGTGYFLHTMRNRGWQTTGIEKNQKAADFGRTHFRLDVYSENELEHLDEDGYDVITLWHVWEHLQALDGVAIKINKALKPDGRVFVALPNSGSADANHYKNNWAAWDVPRHLWHFSTETFSSFVSKHGFEVVAMKGMPFDGFYVSILSEKYKQSRLAFVKGFLYGCVAWLKSLGHPERSSSVIYVLKKNN